MSYFLKNKFMLSSFLGKKMALVIRCFYFCSVAYMCKSYRMGEVVQSVGHGPYVCLLIGPHA